MDPDVMHPEDYDVQKILQDYKSLQVIIAILGIEELSEEDKQKVTEALTILPEPLLVIYICNLFE